MRDKLLPNAGPVQVRPQEVVVNVVSSGDVDISSCCSGRLPVTNTVLSKARHGTTATLWVTKKKCPVFGELRLKSSARPYTFEKGKSTKTAAANGGWKRREAKGDWPVLSASRPAGTNKRR